MKFFLACAFSLLNLALAQTVPCPVLDEENIPRDEYSALHKMVDMCHNDPEALVEELMASPLAAIAKEFSMPQKQTSPPGGEDTLPIVVTHGMGDSCFNRGMKSITKVAGETMDVYSVCIPTGDNRLSDTINGFLLDMDSSVDVFAAKVRADPELANGFNAFGLSQGNNLIRGYIAKYNDPPCHTFMSICGINAGVGAFPNCSPQSSLIGGMCQALTEVLSTLAYNPAVQGLLFQADYFRDPSKTDSDAYKSYSQLAQWGNEGYVINETLKENFAKTDQYVWVLGTEDTVVWPREGEWFGAMDPEDPWNTVLPMNETAWYKDDLFGLRTADEAGKNNFESFDGNHLDFSETELVSWLQEYFA